MDHKTNNAFQRWVLVLEILKFCLELLPSSGREQAMIWMHIVDIHDGRGGYSCYTEAMEKTTLKYLEQFDLLEDVAQVLKIESAEEKIAVILNATIFYAQGGGQPYDQGIIESSSGKFLVEEVRFVEGLVMHIGKFEHGSFMSGDEVKCLVDKTRRQLHARLHSAGHLIDRAITELGLPWKPGKGYHFPQGPYDEYEGVLDGIDKERAKSDIEELCRRYVREGGRTEVLFMSSEEMQQHSSYVPDIPEGKGDRARVVVNAGYYMPCGGTPIADLREIGTMTIRKIKQEKGKIRIGYDVER